MARTAGRPPARTVAAAPRGRRARAVRRRAGRRRQRAGLRDPAPERVRRLLLGLGERLGQLLDVRLGGALLELGDRPHEQLVALAGIGGDLLRGPDLGQVVGPLPDGLNGGLLVGRLLARELRGQARVGLAELRRRGGPRRGGVCGSVRPRVVAATATGPEPRDQHEAGSDQCVLHVDVSLWSSHQHHAPPRVRHGWSGQPKTGAAGTARTPGRRRRYAARGISTTPRVARCGRAPLHVDEPVRRPVVAQPFHQPHQRHLGGVPDPVEHRLAGEEAADRDAVQPAGQPAVPPGLDGVRPPQGVQPQVRLADVVVDPPRRAVAGPRTRRGPPRTRCRRGSRSPGRRGAASATRRRPSRGRTPRCTGQNQYVGSPGVPDGIGNNPRR